MLLSLNILVAGLYTADPRVVPSARLLKQLSYREAQELATLGAKVCGIEPLCLAVSHCHCGSLPVSATGCHCLSICVCHWLPLTATCSLSHLWLTVSHCHCGSLCLTACLCHWLALSLYLPLPLLPLPLVGSGSLFAVLSVSVLVIGTLSQCVFVSPCGSLCLTLTVTHCDSLALCLTATISHSDPYVSSQFVSRRCCIPSACGQQSGLGSLCGSG